MGSGCCKGRAVCPLTVHLLMSAEEYRMKLLRLQMEIYNFRRRNDGKDDARIRRLLVEHRQLYGELLKIEATMPGEDISLQSLSQYEGNYRDTVYFMRNLRNRQRRMRSYSSIQLDDSSFQNEESDVHRRLLYILENHGEAQFYAELENIHKRESVILEDCVESFLRDDRPSNTMDGESLLKPFTVRVQELRKWQSSQMRYFKKMLRRKRDVVEPERTNGYVDGKRRTSSHEGTQHTLNGSRTDPPENREEELDSMPVHWRNDLWNVISESGEEGISSALFRSILQPASSSHNEMNPLHQDAHTDDTMVISKKAMLEEEIENEKTQLKHHIINSKDKGGDEFRRLLKEYMLRLSVLESMLEKSRRLESNTRDREEETGDYLDEDDDDYTGYGDQDTGDLEESIARQREGISEDDVQELLDKHRQERINLQQKRDFINRKIQAKLREKLLTRDEMIHREENSMKTSILNSKDATQEDVGRVLDEHLNKLAALRKRREAERKKIQEKLRAKMKRHEEIPSDDDISESDGESDDDLTDDEDLSDENSQEIKDIEERFRNDVVTMEHGQEVTETNVEEIFDLHRQRRTEHSQAKLIDKLQKRLNALNRDTETDLNLGVEMATNTEALTREVDSVENKMKLLMINKQDHNDEDFQRLLSEYMLRLYQLQNMMDIIMRLNKNHDPKGKGAYYHDNANDYGDEDVDSQEMVGLNESLREDIENQGSDVTEEDVQELLEKHRHQRAQLLQQRDSVKKKMNDKLREKLSGKDQEIEDKEVTIKKYIMDNKESTDEDYHHLLDGHLAELAALRKQRDAEKRIVEENMKLKMRRHGRIADNYHLSDSDSDDDREHSKRESQDNQEIRDLKDKLRKSILEQRDEMTEGNLDEMITHHNQQEIQIQTNQEIVAEKEIIKKLRQDNKDTSKEDYDSLMKKHLQRVAALRKQQENVKKKMEEKMGMKRNKKRETENGDEDEGENDDSSDNSEPTEESREKRPGLDDDVDELMKEHNKQILQRKRQRNDIQKKIAQKLERRRAEAEQKMPRTLPGNEVNDEIDQDFYEKLSEAIAKGELTREDFDEMTKQYLKQKGTRQIKKIPLPKKQKEESLLNAANAIIDETRKKGKKAEIIFQKDRDKVLSKLDEKRLRKKETKQITEDIPKSAHEANASDTNSSSTQNIMNDIPETANDYNGSSTENIINDTPETTNDDIGSSTQNIINDKPETANDNDSSLIENIINDKTESSNGRGDDDSSKGATQLNIEASGNNNTKTNTKDGMNEQRAASPS